jgi:hypothetical protein
LVEDLALEGEECKGEEPNIEVILLTVRGFEPITRRIWPVGEWLGVDTGKHTYRIELEVRNTPACKTLTFSLLLRASR